MCVMMVVVCGFVWWGMMSQDIAFSMAVDGDVCLGACVSIRCMYVLVCVFVCVNVY